MPSPIAHSLAGLAAARLLLPAGVEKPWLWYGVAVVAANAPDLDFVAGLLAGSINAFHGEGSHSLPAALLAAAVAAVPPSRSIGGRCRVAALVAVCCVAHVALDLFTGPAPRRGLPLLWPFSSAEWIAPWLPFAGWRHGADDAGVDGFLAELLSFSNVRSAGFELAVLLPPAALAWLVTRRRDAAPAAAAAVTGAGNCRSRRG